MTSCSRSTRAPPPCNVPALSLACYSLLFLALALAPCSFPGTPGTKAGPIAAFPIFSPSKVCRNARQADTVADTDTDTDRDSPCRPDHASRSMTHDPHLCSPPQTHQGSLHSTPLQVLSASNTHTHTICINLLASCNLQHYACTHTFARFHSVSVNHGCCSSPTVSPITSIPLMLRDRPFRSHRSSYYRPCGSASEINSRRRGT